MKAVIFDLDGTLLDTLTDLTISVNHTLQAYGLPTRAKGEIRSLIGNGAKRLISSLMPEGSPEELELEALAEFRNYYSEHSIDNTRPYPGINDMLEALANRGVKMAVLSNKPHKITVDIVAALLPEYDFICVFGEREGIPRKPDPQSALEVAELMGESPADIFYVGDMRGDVKTAQNSGMTPVGVSWGFQDAGDLRQEGAVYVLDKPSDIFDIMD